MKLVILVSYLTKTNELSEVVYTPQVHTKMIESVKQ